jgi:hypothetical protein
MKWYLALLLVFVCVFVGLIWCSYELAMRYDLKFAYEQHPLNVSFCAIGFVAISILVAKHAKLDLGWLFSMTAIGFLLSQARIPRVAQSARSIRQNLHLDPYYESWQWYEAFLVFSMFQILGFVIAFYRSPGTARIAERSE